MIWLTLFWWSCLRRKFVHWLGLVQGLILNTGLGREICFWGPALVSQSHWSIVFCLCLEAFGDHEGIAYRSRYYILSHAWMMERCMLIDFYIDFKVNQFIDLLSVLLIELVLYSAWKYKLLCPSYSNNKLILRDG